MPEPIIESHEELVVIAVFPELHQALARASDGFEFGITRQTPGIDVAQVQVGQRLQCVVTRRLPRILRVSSWLPPYDPSPMSQAEYEALTAKGALAWADVPDATAWVEQIRGNVPGSGGDG